MKALCSESISDVTTCSDVTSVFVHDKTPLHRRVQASVFWRWTTLHSSALRVDTSCCHSAHFNCTPVNRRLVRPAVAQSFSTTSIVTRPRPSSWWSCPLSIFSTCLAPSPSLLVGSACFKVHSCKVTRRRLHCHVASVPMQHHRNKTRRPRHGLRTRQEHCQVGHQR